MPFSGADKEGQDMDEVLINTTTAGDQGQPGVCSLQGTQFVVVWEDRGDNTIKGQMFGADGVKSSNEILVNLPTPPGPRRQLPAIVEYGSGFVVAWTEQAAGSAATAPAQLKLRIFDADTLSGPEIQVSTEPVEPLIRPALARLSDGNFVVVWADKRDDQRIRVQRFSTDGTRIGGEFRANTVAGLHRVPMVACLTNGDIVVAWRARIAGPLHIRFQIFNAQGPVGGERVTQPTTTAAAIAALDNGQFVIAHLNDFGEDATADTLIVVEAELFNADGSSANHFVSTAEQRIHATWPTLARLPGGRFLVGWVQFNVDNLPATTNVKARLFSTQGPVGQVTQVNTSTGGERFSLAAAVLAGPDGEFAFAAWTDDTGSGSDTAGRAVRGRSLRVPAAGF
ncbi:hypothetical protein C2U70_25065 [Bradyrhizobium guangdongense]|nr:hypothetical protein C2U70_25065 [Bradyrhizobium guangdongense]